MAKYSVGGFTGSSLSEISRKFNINYNTLRWRINSGMDIETAIKTKVRPKNQVFTVRGFKGTLKEISDHFEINLNTLNNRITNMGFSIEEAIEPVDKRIHTVSGVTGTMKEIADHFGIVNYELASSRLSRGWGVEEAIKTPKMEPGKRRDRSL